MSSVTAGGSQQSDTAAAKLLDRIAIKSATVGIIGMGYVGLPLAMAFSAAGFSVLGFDIDPEKVDLLNSGKSYIKHVAEADLAGLTATGRLRATHDFGRLNEPDAVLICVPTPLTRHHEPDLSYVRRSAEAIAACARIGQLIVLESTTYPGTTREVLAPILEGVGLVVGRDIFLAYSPEREDPGNPDYTTAKIPKIIGADDPLSRTIADALYRGVVAKTVPVSSAAVAEAVKITENIFRSVNIALVNELKLVYGAMGIDVWEVIDAAKTKPFGFMPFYPGPGLGGHCIPIDPFYLTWKAREFNQHTRFIELAGQINSAMPEHVVRVLAEAVDRHKAKGLCGARILIVGIAYKKNVDDIRESPALRLIELIEARGARVDFYDPHVSEINATREHPTLNGRKRTSWERLMSDAYDAALIVTDHDECDYAALAQAFDLIVDTRNCYGKGHVRPKFLVSA